jgi:hypothetical protein
MASATKPASTSKQKPATTAAAKKKPAKKNEKQLTVNDLTDDIKAGEGYCQFGNKQLCEA